MAKEEVSVQPQQHAVPLNLWQAVFLIVALIPLSYAVYVSFKSSLANGDSNHPASADGYANQMNSAIEDPNFDTYLSLGITYYNSNRFQEAVDAWENAVKLNPNSDLAYSNLGAAYGCLHNWQEEKRCCERALAINPNFALAQNNLRWAMNELSKSQAPSTGLAGATATQQTNDFNALVNQGVNYYNQKDFTNAIATWQKALTINPNSEIVYADLGAAYGSLGQWKEQVACCQKALSINPNYELAKNNLAWGLSESKKHGINP